MCSILKSPNGFFSKQTQILQRNLASDVNLPIIDRPKSGAFSLLIDESIDKRDDKRPLLSFKVLKSREQQLVYANL